VTQVSVAGWTKGGLSTKDNLLLELQSFMGTLCMRLVQYAFLEILQI
jgi:hypothetical protein